MKGERNKTNMQKYRQKDASQTVVLPASHYHFQIVYSTHLRPILATPTSLRLLWMSNRPVAKSSTGQNTTLRRGRRPCPRRDSESQSRQTSDINPLKPELNPICYLLALLGAHHFLHVSRVRVKLLTFRLLMSYIYIYIYIYI